MKKCKIVSLNGYEITVDHTGLVIATCPELKSLKKQYIRDIYTKYKKRAVFKTEREIDYPLLVDTTTYKEMLEKNPKIALLKEKFDCIIF